MDSSVTKALALIKDKYSGLGAEILCLDGSLAQTSGANNDIGRALSLIGALNNVVFISESQGQGDKLAIQVLTRLNSSEANNQAVRLDMKLLLGAGKDPAWSNFREIIRLIQEPKGKSCLVINALEEVTRDDRMLALLGEVVEKKSIRILGLTDMEGFRRLEARPALSGSLHFILTEKENPQAKRDKSVLIIGASSLLGKALYDFFTDKYGFVKGTGFSKASVLGLDKLDVTSEQEIKQYFSEHPGFDIVAYIAGEADADTAEKERDSARALNTGAVVTIARYAKNSKFVYISSEYVFDGSSGPYGSSSPAHPINYYGHTKLEGEKAALKNFSGALVVRLGALYGYNGSGDKKTTVSKLIAGLDKPEPLQADNVQIKHPLLLEDAVGTILKLLDYGASGIYQINGPEGLNKQKMAEEIAAARKELTGSVFSYPIVGVEQNGTAAKPHNTHMVNVDTPRPFNEGIRFLILKQKLSKEKNSHGH